MNKLEINTKVALRGEYRAVLRDENNKIKHDSGWKPNMILDQGLYNVLANIGCMDVMWLGDSDIPVAGSQTGGQGNLLGTSSTRTTGTLTAANAPDYWVAYVEGYVFSPGVATGTVKEFTLATSGDEGDWPTNGTVRVVLDTPIVKGESDELTIEHKLWAYPDTSTHTGTIDISGVSYDYTALEFGITMRAGIERHSKLLAWLYATQRFHFANPTGLATENPLEAIDDEEPNAIGDIGYFNKYYDALGGSYPSFYKQVQLVAEVDYMNGTFSKLNIYKWTDLSSSSGHYKGLQVELTRTSDGASFTKEDTHEFSLTWRIYSSRYTP